MKIEVKRNELVVGKVYHDSPNNDSIELEFAGYSENGNLLFKEPTDYESRKIYISVDGMIPFAKGGTWYKEVE